MERVCLAVIKTHDFLESIIKTNNILIIFGIKIIKADLNEPK